MSLLVVAMAIVVLILLVAWAKVHPFLAFVIVAGAAALVLGVPPASLPDMVKRGLGGVLGKLLITIVSGAMLGRLVVESGAAQKIATVLVDACGRSRISWAMAITGFIIGIPLFYGVGFVLVVPIVFAVTARYGLPPHPGPTGLVPVLRADMGLTLLYGVVIGVPAIVLAGPVFARTLARVAVRPLAGLETKQLADHELPGGLASILTALLPAVLLLVTTAVRLVLPSVIAAGGPWAAWAAAAEPWVALAADADVVMLLTLAVAAVTLGLLRGRSFASVMQTYASAIGDVASILLVIAGSGAFGAMLLESKVDATVTGLLRDLPVSPLLLAWVVTVIIRACVGSATVAGLTAAGLLAPLAATGDVDPNLMVLAIGSGSLALSHVNDAGFWLFKEYFSLSIADTLRSWTVMETIVAIVGLAGVLVLDRLV